MSSGAMSERELEEMRRLANEAYGQPVAARYERTLAKYLLSAVDEVRRSHTEAAELRERVESLEGIVQSLLGGVSTRVAHFGFYDGHTAQHRKETIDAAYAALSQANAQVKPETRSEEDEEEEE